MNISTVSILLMRNFQSIVSGANGVGNHVPKAVAEASWVAQGIFFKKQPTEGHHALNQIKHQGHATLSHVQVRYHKSLPGKSPEISIHIPLYFTEPLCPEGHSCVEKCPEIEEIKNSPIFVRNALLSSHVEVIHC